MSITQKVFQLVNALFPRENCSKSELQTVIKFLHDKGNPSTEIFDELDPLLRMS